MPAQLGDELTPLLGTDHGLTWQARTVARTGRGGGASVLRIALGHLLGRLSQHLLIGRDNAG